MNVKDLQLALKQTGRYAGEIDGQYGGQSRNAVLIAMTDGPDTQLTDDDLRAAAGRLGCAFSAVKAITTVESSSAGFSEGRPVLLFEPHRFSRATNHQFDATHPDVSYSHWDRTRYPKTQAGRYDQLLKAVGLAVDAGFASASYGRFQILGENFRACGFLNSFEFAAAQAFDERHQLGSFENFVKSNTALLVALRKKDWVNVARCYNGTAFEVNHYDERLANADKKFAS